MGVEYNATVLGRAEVAPGSMIIRIAPDKRPFEFQPGQYAVLGLKATEPRVDEADADGPHVLAEEATAGMPEGRSALEAQAAAAAQDAADPGRMIRRAFCMTSESRAAEYLDFYVTLILSGELTPRLFNLQSGARLYVGPKAEGVFTLSKESSKNVLMIATGTGLAPYMSMIRNELELNIQGRIGVRGLRQCNGSRQFVMVHGARYSWDLAFRTELTGLARHCANFHYIPVITRPQEDITWRGRSGYLQNLIASNAIAKETGLAVTPDNFDIFLCGNPGMIDSAIGWAEARGFTRSTGHAAGTLHVERFW